MLPKVYVRTQAACMVVAHPKKPFVVLTYLHWIAVTIGVLG